MNLKAELAPSLEDSPMSPLAILREGHVLL